MEFVHQQGETWGRIVRGLEQVAVPRFAEDLPRIISGRAGRSLLAVGKRRSYGDSALNSEGGVVSMTALDRFIAFDREKAELRVEAGATLGEIMRSIVPRGFFVPVTPGTRFVTVGGAIANDVHGKNHHRAGTFGRPIARMGLLRGDGERVVIGPSLDSDLFAATVGGLGLTGVIEWADIKLEAIKSSQIDVERISFGSLSEFWDLAQASSATQEHTVAWIDCVTKGARAGRGVFSRGNWSDEGGYVSHDPRQRLAIPVDAPNALLNHLAIALFNQLYYTAQKRKPRVGLEHYATFLHPLDSIANWNRIYGRRGFWQYQCVVPPATMKDAIEALLAEILRSGDGSFLAVLKTCGDLASPGLLSFPMEGATLALDFANRGHRTLQLFSRLDAIVREAGGRLYAAKDGRIPKDMWAAGYPNMQRFSSYVDPAFASDFWRRVAA